jgi:hypothetical protein
MPDLPVNLQSLLDDALEVMRANRFHDLPMGYRCAIYAALGSPRARAGLALAAARRACQPGADANAGLALDFADRAAQTGLAGEFPAALKAYERELVQSEDPRGWAALIAAQVAFDDRGLWRAPIPLAQTDEGLRRSDRDAAFYAVCAEAGGPLWYKWQDALKRRAFWEWWLGEAVPAAYRRAQES